MTSLICGILKKNDTKKLISKTETGSQISKTKFMVAKGERSGEGIN